MPTRLIFLIQLVILLPGCAGLAVGTYGKHEIGYERIAIRDERGDLGGVARPGGYSSNDVVELWGEPDTIREKGECGVLEYTGGISWAGGGVFLGLFPIPLVVPTGRYVTRFYVREDSVIRTVSETGDVGLAAGYMCGSNECLWLFGRNPMAPEKSVEVDWCEM